ncbi:hypothetical protein BKA57DRAFT_478985 [Linnemannia elongata]|nr:hypothetical protein BKA57DRAFT_478985 [Linnemannia elongata]
MRAYCVCVQGYIVYLLFNLILLFFFGIRCRVTPVLFLHSLYSLPFSALSPFPPLLSIIFISHASVHCL